MGIGLVMAGAMVASGLLQGYASNEKDKKQKKAYELELEQTKERNRYGALDASSSMLLNSANASMNLDSSIATYNRNIDLYTSQAVQGIGSANASSASTGFRNSGSNMSRAINAQKEYATQLMNATSSARTEMYNNGISVMNGYSQSQSALNNYRTNIAQAIKMTEMKVDNLGVADNYLFSDRMFFDASVSALGATSSWASTKYAYNLGKKGK